MIADFSDPTNERIILLSAAGLFVVGVALLVGTILWWRRGRQEHPALAPLEVMGTRTWAKAPEGDRNRRLERVRVAGHPPGPDEPERFEPVDLQALVRSVPQAFDDLREPGALADDDWLSWVVGLPDGDVAEADEVSPVDEAGPDEAGLDEAASVEAPSVEAPSPNGTATVAVDPDATSYSAERPSAPVAPPAGGKEPVANSNGADAGALASSHGEAP